MNNCMKSLLGLAMAGLLLAGCAGQKNFVSYPDGGVTVPAGQEPGTASIVNQDGGKWLVVAGSNIALPLVGPWQQAKLENSKGFMTQQALLTPAPTKNGAINASFKISTGPLNGQTVNEIIKKHHADFGKHAEQRCTQRQSTVAYQSPLDGDALAFECTQGEEQSQYMEITTPINSKDYSSVVIFSSNGDLPAEYLQAAQKMMRSLEHQANQK